MRAPGTCQCRHASGWSRANSSVPRRSARFADFDACSCSIVSGRRSATCHWCSSALSSLSSLSRNCQFINMQAVTSREQRSAQRQRKISLHHIARKYSRRDRLSKRSFEHFWVTLLSAVVAVMIMFTDRCEWECIYWLPLLCLDTGTVQPTDTCFTKLCTTR